MSDHTIILLLGVVCIFMLLEINSLIKMIVNPLKQSAVQIKKHDKRKATYQRIINRKDYAGTRVISVGWILIFTYALIEVMKFILVLVSGVR